MSQDCCCRNIEERHVTRALCLFVYIKCNIFYATASKWSRHPEVKCSKQTLSCYQVFYLAIQTNDESCRRKEREKVGMSKESEWREREWRASIATQSKRLEGELSEGCVKWSRDPLPLDWHSLLFVLGVHRQLTDAASMEMLGKHLHSIATDYRQPCISSF